MLYYLPVLIILIANATYHLFQKSINPQIHPLVSLIITYITSIILSLLLFFFFPLKTSFISSLKSLNWANFALGASIIGLEVGFLLAYRLNWKISNALLITNILVAIILLFIGISFYKEKMSPVNLLGFVLSLIGIILLSIK
jgi:uncharacterized membrane protein